MDAKTKVLIEALIEAAKEEHRHLEEGGAYLVEKGFEEPDHCRRFRNITEALAAFSLSSEEMPSILRKYKETSPEIYSLESRLAAAVEGLKVIEREFMGVPCDYENKQTCPPCNAIVSIRNLVRELESK